MKIFGLISILIKSIVICSSPSLLAQNENPWKNALPTDAEHRKYTNQQYEDLYKEVMNNLEDSIEISQWANEGQENFVAKFEEKSLKAYGQQHLKKQKGRARHSKSEMKWALQDISRLEEIQRNGEITWQSFLLPISRYLENYEGNLISSAKTKEIEIYNEAQDSTNTIRYIHHDVLEILAMSYDWKNPKHNYIARFLPSLSTPPSSQELEGKNGEEVARRYIKTMKNLIAKTQQEAIDILNKIEAGKIPPESTYTSQDSLDASYLANLAWKDYQDPRGLQIWLRTPSFLKKHLRPGVLQDILDKQRMWLLNYILTDDYLHRLSLETKTEVIKADKLRIWRINSLIEKDYKIEFDFSAYSRWVVRENQVYFSAYDVAKFPSQGMQEFGHQLTRGVSLLSPYAKNLYSEGIVSREEFDALKDKFPSLFMERNGPNGSYQYFSNFSELDARRLGLLYEIEEEKLIDTVIRPFSKADINNLKKQAKDGSTAISNNSAQFLLLLKVDVLVRILNELA